LSEKRKARTFAYRQPQRPATIVGARRRSAGIHNEVQNAVSIREIDARAVLSLGLYQGGREHARVSEIPAMQDSNILRFRRVPVREKGVASRARTRSIPCHLER
jgi:hypothetical protein